VEVKCIDILNLGTKKFCSVFHASAIFTTGESIGLDRSLCGPYSLSARTVGESSV
jgi:hypothetical protein